MLRNRSNDKILIRHLWKVLGRHMIMALKNEVESDITTNRHDNSNQQN